MRTYESFSEQKALRKVAMFNAGEIALMQELGLSPVFYGQALVGRDLPQLHLHALRPGHGDPQAELGLLRRPSGWFKLKNDPQYADTVSKITSRFLFRRRSRRFTRGPASPRSRRSGPERGREASAGSRR